MAVVKKLQSFAVELNDGQTYNVLATSRRDAYFTAVRKGGYAPNAVPLSRSITQVTKRVGTFLAVPVTPLPTAAFDKLAQQYPAPV